MPIDNNLLERDIRIFATGRKSWLFSDTVDGARASAVVYSLMLTCRASRVEPLAWVAPRPHRITSARRRRRYHRPAALQLPQNCHCRLIQRDAFPNQTPKGGVNVRGKSRLRSRSGWASNQSRRRFRTSGRSRSSAWADFFERPAPAREARRSARCGGWRRCGSARSRAAISCSVMSRRSSISPTMKASCASRLEPRRRPCGRAVRSPVLALAIHRCE